MLKKNSLSFRIIVRVLLITTTLFVLIITLYYFYARNSIQKATKEYAIQLAGNIAGKVEGELKPLEKIPQMVSASIGMGFFQEDSLIRILETVVERNPNIYGACVAFEPNYFPDKGKYFMPYVYRDNGNIYKSFLGGHDYQYFYMDWYQIPKMLDTPYWSEPYFDEGGGNILMTTYSHPIYTSFEGKPLFIGVATIDVALDKLTDYISEIKIFETGYAFMITRNGVAVTHPDKTQIMNSSVFSIAEDWQAPILRDIGRELMQGKSNFRSYDIPGRNKRWIYYTNLDSIRWSVAVVYPDDEMFASLRQMNFLLVVLILAGLLVLSVITTGIVKRLAAPLGQFADSARQIAQGDFDVELPKRLNSIEMQELNNAFSHMQNQLAVYIENLKETTSAKEKIESELRIARDIQMSMIPHSFPPFPDLPQVDLYAMLKSAKEVGGDLYDFFVLDKNKFCFAIGDVSGKGVPASLFMAVTRTLLRSIADKHKAPAAIMNVLNKSLSLNNDSCMFVTFFLGILDIETGQLSYANAGHNPPLHIKVNGDVVFMDMGTSIPLGLMGDYAYNESSIQLLHGEKIFSYTDGVSEAENAEKVLYGELKIQEVIAENYGADPRGMISKMAESLEKHVNGYEQSDDITMMTINFNGNETETQNT